MTFFEVLFFSLGIDLYAKSTLIISISTGVLLGVGLVPAVLTGVVYFSNISALLLFAKPIERKEDVKRTPSGLINRCVVEYMACGENGAPLLAVDSIVTKHILRMSFLGISFKSLEKLSKSVDYALLGVMAAAVISTSEPGWLAFVGGAWIVYRAVLLFFDAETLREKLFYGITTYINRELGKFYIADDKAGMRIFKNELHSSLMEQASILQNAVNNLTRELMETIKASYGELGKALAADISKYDNLGEKLKSPVEGMQAIFGKFAVSAETLEKSSAELSHTITLLEDKLEIITGSLEKNTAANTRSINNSELLFHELRDSLKSFGAAYQALEAEVAAVKNAQQSLELALSGYELSMQQTANRVGDALGSVVKYSGGEAADALNEAVSAHVKQFSNDTSRLVEKMAVLFEQLSEQNKTELQTLLRIEKSLKAGE